MRKFLSVIISGWGQRFYSFYSFDHMILVFYIVEHWILCALQQIACIIRIFNVFCIGMRALFLCVPYKI